MEDGPNLDDIVSIPDAAFLTALIEEGVDTDDDGVISFGEAKSVSYLRVLSTEIRDLKGIGAFVNLDTLLCRTVQISEIDLSKNIKLKCLSCDGCSPMFWIYDPFNPSKKTRCIP